MNRRYLVALSFLIAVAIAACAGACYRNAARLPDESAGEPVEALAMTTARANAAAIRLRDGRALICAAPRLDKLAACSPAPSCTTRPAHLHVNGSMTVPRAGETITMLRDGRVLLTGAFRTPASALSSRVRRFTIRPRALSARPARCQWHAKAIRRRCFATEAFLSPAAATTVSTRWTRPRFSILQAVRSAAPGICISRASRTSRRCSAPAKF